MNYFYKILATFLLFLSLNSISFAQLSGTYNIPGDYATISDAVTALNSLGVGSGGVTFNVAAGHTETITARINLTATGTAANPIVFQKSGTGANPLIRAYTGTATPGSATPDGIWALVGSDYVTIDGIDLLDPNTTNPATMEYGYGLFKASVTNGCQYVTIRNCNITLNRINNATGSGPMPDGSTGILVVNSTPTAATTALIPTASSGSNSFNTFRSNTVTNANNGIVLMGFAATAGVGPSPDPATFLGDMGNDIGGTSASHGNTILNYGGASGATNPAAGIRANNQWSINISYNVINNNNGGGVNHPNTLRGIFAQAGTSANATINNNEITIRGGGTTQQVAAIENGIGGTPLSNTVSINNNIITGDYLTATSGVFYGIFNNNVAPATLNIQNNTVQNLSYSATALTGTGAVYPIYTTGSNAASTFNVTNNTVNNISRTGTTGGTTIGIFISAGTGGMVINVNNNIVSNMSIDGAGTASIMYGIQVPTGTVTVNNNTIFGLTCIKSTGTGEMNGIRSFASPTIESYNNNTVYNLTHNGTGTLRGIYAYTTTGTRTMSNNTVYNLTSGGLTVTGLENNSSSPTIANNRIYNIISTSTGTPTVSGILVGSSLGTSGFANIYNNFISEIKAPNATFTAQSAIVRGINLTVTTTTTNIYVYYNTVYLDATSSGTNFSSAAIFHTANTTATTANLIMRNNIFVNNSTPNGTGLTVAYWRSSTALSNYDNSSNNNLFYAGTPSSNRLIFYDGTNSDQTIASYKARVAPRDANSFTENPPFVDITTSPYNLHIDPATATQIESGGLPISTPVAITTDFDGDTRNTTTPDVGADEGDFTPLDLTPPAITYTLLGNGIVAGSRAFNNVTITDPSGVNTDAGTKPRVYYKKTTDPNNINGWAYVEADNDASPFNFTIDYSKLIAGSVSVGDTIQYFVVAQDLSDAVNVGINSGTFANPQASVNLAANAFPIGGTINRYAIVGTISGTVTVGTGGTYPSLTGPGGLFADINSKVVTGNITAFILGDLSETGANALNQWSEEPSGSGFTLTIAPNDGTVKTISGSFAGGLIRLNGADRVTIDGRYSGSGNYLTFSNTATSGTIATIQIISLGTGAGANNVTIRNCNISTGFNAATSYAIHAGAATLGTAGNDNDNLAIIDNVITKAYNAIWVRSAGTTTGLNDNLIVSGNVIGSNSASDYVIFRGIDVQGAAAPIISQNEIFNLKTTSSINIAAIDLGQYVSDAIVSRNKIYGIWSTSSSGYGAYGINISSGIGTNNIRIDNNLIYDLITANYSTTSTTWNAFGIRITGGTNHKIYFNSINFFGSVTSGTSAGMSANMVITAASPGLDVRNNIFVNTQTFGVTGSFAYNIYLGTTGISFGTINYNDYFGTSGTNTTYRLGYDGTAARPALTDWVSYTSQDGNSLAVNPQFNSNTNLQPQLGSPVLAAGTPISGITTDFLGVTRSATNPSIGAYEEGLDGSAPTITYTPLGNTSSTSNRTITATIADVSGVPTSGSLQPRIWYRRNHPTPATGWVSTQGTLQSGTGYSGVWEFTIDYTVLGISPEVGDSIQYYIVAQDLASTPNIGTQPAGGVHTDVNNQTSAPANPSRYKIVGPPLSGTYTISSAMFRNITGLDIQFEKKVIQVEKEAIVEIQGNSDTKDLRTDRNNSEILESSTLPYAPGLKQKVKVEEEIYVPMLNGIPYEGKLVANKGDYNLPLGTESVYLTITAALADLNERGVGGPVTFLLADTIYSTEETFPLSINIQNENLPTSTNTVTFKPADGVSTSINGSVASGPVLRISSNYIIINGTYDSDPSGRNLSITNSSTTSPQVIRIGSIGTTAVVGVQVRNCNITNGSQASSAVIIANYEGTVSAGYFNNILIDNNSVKKAYIGIYALAIVQAGNGGITISNNSLNSTGSDAIRYVGIYAQGCENFVVTQNNIANFSSTESENDAGIWIASGSKNGSITRNRINSIKYTGTSGYGAYGIRLTTATTDANVLVANNVIYDISGDGYDITGTYWADNPFGILAAGTQTGLNIYFNSINLYGNTLNRSNAASVGIMLGTGTVADIRNNIVVNNLGRSAGTGLGSFGVFAQGSNTQFSNINYNLYYVNPTGTGVKAVGRIVTTNHTTLSDWKTATGQDAYSISGDPGFTSDTNLLPDNSNVNSWNVANKGVHISSVNVDFTGATRPTSPATGVPDIGAYEFANPTIAPPAALQTGTLATGGTTNYSQGGMPLGQINWGSAGTVPDSVSFNYYSGTPAPVPGSFTQPRINAYWNITVSGGSGYTYDLTLNYGEATLGSINENNLIVAKSDDGGTTWVPYTTVGTGPGQIIRDTTANTIKVHGLSSFSLFTLGDGGDPLPVELTSFSARVKNRDVTLEWGTATEVNVLGFEIERKLINEKDRTAEKWVKVDFVRGSGNSNKPLSYSYTDSKLNTGKYLYRLKMVDIDGSFSYSNEVMVEVDKPTITELKQNYPNSFNPETRIEYQLSNPSRVRLEVYNITGELIAVLVDKELDAGYYLETFNANKVNGGLSSGVYIYRMIADDKVMNKRIVQTKKMLLIK